MMTLWRRSARAPLMEGSRTLAVRAVSGRTQAHSQRLVTLRNKQATSIHASLPCGDSTPLTNKQNKKQNAPVRTRPRSRAASSRTSRTCPGRGSTPSPAAGRWSDDPPGLDRCCTCWFRRCCYQQVDRGPHCRWRRNRPRWALLRRGPVGTDFGCTCDGMSELFTQPRVYTAAARWSRWGGATMHARSAAAC